MLKGSLVWRSGSFAGLIARLDRLGPGPRFFQSQPFLVKYLELQRQRMRNQPSSTTSSSDGQAAAGDAEMASVWRELEKRSVVCLDQRTALFECVIQRETQPQHDKKHHTAVVAIPSINAEQRAMSATELLDAASDALLVQDHHRLGARHNNGPQGIAVRMVNEVTPCDVWNASVAAQRQGHHRAVFVCRRNASAANLLPLRDWPQLYPSLFHYQSIDVPHNTSSHDEEEEATVPLDAVVALTNPLTDLGLDVAPTNNNSRRSKTAVGMRQRLLDTLFPSPLGAALSLSEMETQWHVTAVARRVQQDVFLPYLETGRMHEPHPPCLKTTLSDELQWGGGLEATFGSLSQYLPLQAQFVHRLNRVDMFLPRTERYVRQTLLPLLEAYCNQQHGGNVTEVRLAHFFAWTWQASCGEREVAWQRRVLEETECEGELARYWLLLPREYGVPWVVAEDMQHIVRV